MRSTGGTSTGWSGAARSRRRRTRSRARSSSRWTPTSPSQAWKEAQQLWADDGPDGPSGPGGGSGGPDVRGRLRRRHRRRRAQRPGLRRVLRRRAAGPRARGPGRGRRRLRDEGGRGAGLRHNFHSNFHGSSTWARLSRPRPRALRRHLSLAGEPVRPRVPRRAAPVCSRDLDTTVERIARFSKRDADTFREVAQVYLEVLRDGFIPAMFAPPGPPSGDLAPLEGSSDGLGLDPAVPHRAEPRRARPVRVARGPDLGRVLGRAARRHRRRVRPRRELPGDGRRLDGAVRLGDLRGRPRTTSRRRWRRSCGTTAARSGWTRRSRGSRWTAMGRAR